MDGIIDTMNGLKIKAVQASNQGVMGDDQINIIRKAVTSAKETLQTIGNTKVLNRYIFGGTKTETVPFQSDENGKTIYNGNEEDLNLQVSDFENIPIAIPGSRLMSIFGVVERFEKALEEKDFDGIRNAIGEIDDSFDTITTIASDVGNTLNKMEFLFEQYELSNIEYQAEISRLTDTDYAEALSNLEKFNISYQAAIEANQRLINTSLVNLLR
jgi:flagellar hook-associated protein 3 FlgL